MKCLTGSDRLKVISIVNNFQHELSVLSVIYNTSPGEIFVDNSECPKSFLIKAPECNLIGGYSNDICFNEEIKKKISYFDSLLPDNEEWEKNIMILHPNCAINPYKRKYFKQTERDVIIPSDSTTQVELIYPDMIDRINYENKNILLDWISGLEIKSENRVCLGVIVIIDGRIVSCSAIDCIHKDSVEIGVKTISSYRKMGYGVLAVSSLVNELQKNGISDIGWHCMSTNIGSQKIANKCGFKEICEYPVYFPYPPIENINDISKEDWINKGQFFVEKGKNAVDQFWQAARCFAKAEEINQVFECIQKLIKNNQLWFLEYIDECEEFSALSNNNEWNEIIKI